MLEGARRFSVACCGRRFGKTQFGIEQLVFEPGGALDGKPVAWFAPSYKLLLDVWKEVAATCEPVIDGSNRSEMRIRFLGGGTIDFWTLLDASAGRGRKYARVVIDEAAHARNLKDVWEQAISPTLADYRGEAWFISTPNGMNFFHELYLRGADGAETDWASFTMPTSVNPYIAPDEIERQRQYLPELVFRQEYLAEFVDLAGNIVRTEWIRSGEPPAGLRLAMGVDLAISLRDSADYTACVVMGRDSSGTVWVMDADRVRATFNEVLQFIRRKAEQWRPYQIAIEDVQYQSAVVQELLRTTTLPVRGVRPDRDKLSRFLPLAARYEQGLVRHASGLPPLFEREVCAFPSGEHDDLVDAAAYAFAGLGATGAPKLVTSGRTRAAQLLEEY